MKNIIFKDVIERIKSSANINNDYEVADAMGIDKQKLANQKLNNIIKIDQLINICDTYNLSLDNILMGKDNEKQYIDLSTAVIKTFKKLSPKKQELYYHKMKADLLEEELK